MGLRIRLKRVPGVVTLTPDGAIDTKTCSVFDGELAKVAAEPVKTLVLDMAGVDFITSSGISAIAKARASMTDKGGDFAIVNLQPQVKRVFEIMRLLPELNVFGGREELDEYLGKVQRRMIDDEQQ